MMRMSRQNDRKLLARPVTPWLVLPVALVVGWSSGLVAAPLVVTAGSPATGADMSPPGTDAAPAAPAADAFPPTVPAGDSTPPARRSRPITWWVATGFGPGKIGGQDGQASHVEFALAAGIHLFSLRYVLAEDTNSTCGGPICMGNDALGPHNSVKEIALQYGLKWRAPYLLGTASAGVAALWTVQRGDALQFLLCGSGCLYEFNEIDSRAVGATAEIGGYLTSRYVSVGPTFVIDVNSIQSFWSVLIDLHFGWMGNAH